MRRRFKIFFGERVLLIKNPRLQAIDQKFKTSQLIRLIKGLLDEVHLPIVEFALAKNFTTV